jgi:hypothetical protein
MTAARLAAPLLAVFAAALPGVVEARAAEIVELARAPVVLTAPADGTELAGGQWTELAWEPAGDGPAWSAIEAAEEWELFLSVDAGASFSVRLTPHLDLERRHVSFEVPNLASDDVRLLFRYGDERRERAFRLPGRFRIRPGRSPVADAAAGLSTPGEPALPGARGVARWSDGTRDGARRVERSAGLGASALSGAPFVDALEVAALRAEEPAPETLAAHPPLSRSAIVRPRAQPAARVRRTAQRNTDPFLLLGRRNE